jgi:hypothetical protein
MVGLSTHYGIGKHIWELDFSQLPLANKYLFVGECFVMFGLAVAKSSFCVTLLRIATKMWQKILLWFAIVSTMSIMGFLSIIFFVSCTPVEKTFDFNVPGTCWDINGITKYGLFAGCKSNSPARSLKLSLRTHTRIAWSTFTDFWLALFPWILIWKLQMKKVEKIGVCVAMSLGVL